MKPTEKVVQRNRLLGYVAGIVTASLVIQVVEIIRSVLR